MRRRYSNPWLLMLLAYALLPLICGCASTHTVLRLGVSLDITDIVENCDRKTDATCGRPGSRDLAFIEVLWAPSIKPGPWCSFAHQSGITAGRPFNDRLDQVIDTIGCGGFFQWRDRP